MIADMKVISDRLLDEVAALLSTAFPSIPVRINSFVVPFSVGNIDSVGVLDGTIVGLTDGGDVCTSQVISPNSQQDAGHSPSMSHFSPSSKSKKPSQPKPELLFPSFPSLKNKTDWSSMKPAPIALSLSSKTQFSAVR